MNAVKRKSFYSKRFTLIEVLVVVGILAVLMGIGLGVMSFAMTKASENKTKALIKKIEVALENYKSEHGYYIQSPDPTQRDKFYLDSVGGAGDSEKVNNNFCKYIDYEKAIQNDCKEESGRYYFVDGFDEAIMYQCPGAKNTTSFDLWSDGSDTSTTEDDITNY